MACLLLWSCLQVVGVVVVVGSGRGTVVVVVCLWLGSASVLVVAVASSVYTYSSRSSSLCSYTSTGQTMSKSNRKDGDRRLAYCMARIEQCNSQQHRHIRALLHGALG